MNLEAALPVVILCSAIVILAVGFAGAAWIGVQALQLVLSLAIVIRQNTGLFQDADLQRAIERQRMAMALLPRKAPASTTAGDGTGPPPAPVWSDADIMAGVVAGRSDEQILNDIAHGRPVATTGDITIPNVDLAPPAANNGEAFNGAAVDGERSDESVAGTGMYAEEPR